MNADRIERQEGICVRNYHKHFEGYRLLGHGAM